MEKKHIKIINKSGQDILLENFVIKANSSLNIPENFISDYMWRRINSLENLNKISHEVISSIVTINPVKVEPKANTVVTTTESEEKVELLDVRNVPIEEMRINEEVPIESEEKSLKEVIEPEPIKDEKPKKRGRKKNKKE